MLIQFDQMPDTSRVWIYQAERKLSSQEIDFVKNSTSDFLSNWSAHGYGLKAAFKIEYDQFLVITVDESFSQASGCSIDASVNLIKALEQQTGISFITNGLVGFLIENEVKLLPFNEIKKEISANHISESTPMFNNTIQHLSDFKSKWLVESGQGWVSRYF
ncbi:MAG: hypothetical protein AB8B73_02215 [Ekhidna sp.]